MRIGILALQGDYAAHAATLAQLNVQSCFVRNAQELDTINGLIIPGGESTTLLKFLGDGNFFQALKIFGASKPTFGTCAGAILLAKEVCSPAQPSLELIDISILRNAYGRQLQSHVDHGVYEPDSSPLEMVFIRAPQITRHGPGVRIIASCQGEPVAVQENHILAATFHPELSTDLRLHRHFCKVVK